jgi:hypothetical protein
MNKVHGKTISYPKWTFYSKVMTRNLFFCKEWAASFLAGHKGENLFFPNPCGQLLRNFFAHVLLVV